MLSGGEIGGGDIGEGADSDIDSYGDGTELLEGDL